MKLEDGLKALDLARDAFLEVMGQVTKAGGEQVVRYARSQRRM